MSLFQLGTYQLASGTRSDWKIECDALTTSDWDALAFMAVERGLAGVFDEVIGVPRGGEPFARALTAYARRTPSSAPRLLVVDDVYTTGFSLLNFMARPPKRDHVGALVAFSRSSTPLPTGVYALFTLNDYLELAQ